MGLVGGKAGKEELNSALTEDLRAEGIQCIEKVPQIAQIRDASTLFDSIDDLLAENNIAKNVESLLRDQAEELDSEKS